MSRQLLESLCRTHLWVTGDLIGSLVVLDPHEWMPPETNKQKNMGMSKVTDADCRNVDFTSEPDFLCLILHKSREMGKPSFVLVNTRTSSSNCAIRNSCLLTRWCVIVFSDRLKQSLHVVYSLFTTAEWCWESAGERVGVRGMWCV